MTTFSARLGEPLKMTLKFLCLAQKLEIGLFSPDSCIGFCGITELASVLCILWRMRLSRVKEERGKDLLHHACHRHLSLSVSQQQYNVRLKVSYVYQLDSGKER